MVTAVTGGNNFTCAIVNGIVKCWGRNLYGGLGRDMSYVNSYIPDNVLGLPSTNVTTVAVNNASACAIPELSSGVTKISSGSRSTCAVINGGVKCFRNNGTG